jgi:hypothetical protein
MSEKDRLLFDLCEQYNLWEDLLARIGEARIAIPLAPSAWSPKDEVAHLHAWQQRTLARAAAVKTSTQPAFPAWPADLDPDVEPDVDRINAWLYESSKALSWDQVREAWRATFLALLETCGEIPEQVVSSPASLPGLNGQFLAYFLQGTLDHHREHLEDLKTRLLGNAG